MGNKYASGFELDSVLCMTFVCVIYRVRCR